MTSSKFNRSRFFIDRTGPSVSKPDSEQVTVVQRFDEFMSAHSLDSDEYRAAIAASMNAGVPAWGRDFDGDRPPVFYYFNGEREVGLIQYMDDVAKIFVFADDGSTVVLDEINTASGPENLVEAIERLEAIANPSEEH